MESILTSIKKLLGIAEDYEQFDPDITMHINSVLIVLGQLGVIYKKTALITTKTDLWADFIENPELIQVAITYSYLKVKLLFDPPTSSAVIEIYNKQISELEWRIMVMLDPKPIIQIIPVEEPCYD